MKKLVKQQIFLLFLLLFFGMTPRPLFADSATASLTVPPKTTDFQFSLSGTTATNSPPNTTLTYTITYGANSSASFTTNPVIVADFSADTVDGTHVLDYVVGGATNGYGNANPVVDLGSRTITWSITNLPAGTTNQSVTFQLKTNNNYTGSNQIAFTIKTNQHNEYVTLPEQTATGTYLYGSSSSSSPTPTSTPTPLPTTPTPTASLASIKITDVSITGLTASNATIGVTTDEPAKITLLYGTSSHALSQTLASPQALPYTTLTMDTLSPQTTYYFQVVATGANGSTTTSDIFSIKTPTTTETIPSDNTTTALEVNNSIIHSQSSTPTHSTTPQIAILPTNQLFELAYTLPSSFHPKQIEAILQSVLGIHTFYNRVVSMLQRSSGLYVASLATPSTPGDYGIFVRIVSQNGTITQQQIAQIHVIPSLLILDKKTDNPITNARVFFYVFNPQTKAYQPVAGEFGALTNPLYSDNKGRVQIVLPAGKYKIDVNALGYKTQTITFVLGTASNQGYPTVRMTKQAVTIFALFTYFKNSLLDFLQNLILWMQTIGRISRYMDLFALLIITTFIVITYISFALKTGILLKNIPLFLEHHLHLLSSKHPSLSQKAPLMVTSSFYGYIGNSNRNPLTDSEIFVNDVRSLKIIYKTKTNKLGKFIIPHSFLQKPVILHVYGEGFIPFSQQIDKDTVQPLVLSLAEGYAINIQSFSLFKHIIYFVEQLLSAGFEVLLFASLGFELLLAPYLGMIQVAPYILLSMINLVAWIFFIKEYMERKILFS